MILLQYLIIFIFLNGNNKKMSSPNPQDNEVVEPLEMWFPYVGEPNLDESRSMYLQQDPPNILGFYKHRIRVFQRLIDSYEPFTLEYRVYTKIIEFWQNRVHQYKQDKDIMERMESGWYFYRNRFPIPINETIDQMNRRLYPSLYVVQEEENEIDNNRGSDDGNDSGSDDDISLKTQPDENLE